MAPNVRVTSIRSLLANIIESNSLPVDLPAVALQMDAVSGVVASGGE
jgi:hypothetical protein